MTRRLRKSAARLLLYAGTAFPWINVAVRATLGYMSNATESPITQGEDNILFD